MYLYKDMYLYTDKKGNKVAIKYFSRTRWETEGEIALDYRKTLEKKLKKPVVAWCIMGGDNGEIDITNH